MHAEGWYLDPFRLHEDRWFSDGRPTALVRDGGTESHDPPPDTPLEGPPRPVAEPLAGDGSDLLRAGDDDPDNEIFDPDAAVGGVFDTFGESGGD